MKLVNKQIFKSLLGAVTLSLCTLQASAQDLGITPYLHPNPCDVKADPRGFEVYPSKNCETLFLAPKVVEKSKNVVSFYGSKDACSAHNNMLGTLVNRSSNFQTLIGLASQALENGNLSDYQMYSDEADKAEEKFIKSQERYAKFTKLPAAHVQSLFENRVSGQDIYDFIQQNILIFWSAEKRPEVTPIKIGKSIYSFTHYRPKEASEEARSILSTTIPGMEPLAQPSAQQVNVAHVKAKDSISGSTELSLMAACPMLENVGGEWVEKKDAFREVLTVNRSYEVPMKAGYSLTASLDTNIATEVLAKMIVQTANHGLSKTQFFERLLNIEGKKVFTMTYDEDHSFTKEEKLLIDYNVQKRLVDQFLQIYESRKELSDLKPIELPAPTGGNVDVVHTARRCWSSSSFFGLKKSGGCYDYQYTVPTWVEGKSYNEVVELLRVNVKISETVRENKIFNYPMSSTFFNGDK